MQATTEDLPFVVDRTEYTGRSARNKIVLHNIKLVVHWANRARFLLTSTYLDLDDLIQAGAIGLMRAAEKFDVDKGFAFSTYATWWIRQALTRESQDARRGLRIPVHMEEKLRRLQRTARTADLDPYDLPDDVLQGLTDRDAGETRRLLLRARRPLSFEILGDLERTQRTSQEQDNWQEMAMETPDSRRQRSWAPTRDEARMSVIPSDAEETLFEGSAQAELMQHITAALSELPGRPRQILLQRNGFDGGAPITLEQLGDQYGVTRERIRQIETKALRSVRSGLVHRYPGLSRFLIDDES